MPPGPLWAKPTVGDRVYMVGRWILDAGHPEIGDRTEMHTPRLVAAIRQRPSVMASGATATQSVFDFSAIRRFQAGRAGVEAAKDHRMGQLVP